MNLFLKNNCDLKISYKWPLIIREQILDINLQKSKVTLLVYFSLLKFNEYSLLVIQTLIILKKKEAKQRYKNI